MTTTEVYRKHNFSYNLPGGCTLDFKNTDLGLIGSTLLAFLFSGTLLIGFHRNKIAKPPLIKQ